MSTTTTTDGGGSTVRGAWRTVARREISTTLNSRSFQISTALLLVALIGTVVLVGILSGRETRSTVAVVDPTSRSIVEQASKVADRIRHNTTLTPTAYVDRGAAEKAVRGGDVDAALLRTGSGYEVVGDGSVDDTVGQALQIGVQQSVLGANARDQGVDLTTLQSGSRVDQRLLDPDAKDAGLRQIAGLVFVVLFYITALGFGMQIAASVCQEKESRVVEILAAAVPIRALLWGKVIGQSVLAIAQTFALILVGSAALLVTGRGHDLAVVAPALGWYALFFVLGFVALASFWAAAGSLAGRQQDLQSTTAPAQILLFAPYLISVAAGEGVRTVVSMFPVVSTMLMPSRIVEGSVPTWQIATAIAVTVAAAVLMVRLGARIYEGTLLRTGTKIGFREAFDARRAAGD